MATNVHLTPELEHFARACVDSGRFNNISEVVRSALRLLQTNEARYRDFAVMLAEVRGEAARDGVHGAEAIAAEMDAIIDSTRK